MSRLIALDTETTGLDPDDEVVFEIACVDIDTGQEWVWTIQPPDEVVEAMHPKAAEVNRYHVRTADPNWTWSVPAEPFGGDAWHEWLNLRETALEEITEVLDGSHVVGAVPDFDTRFLTSLFRSDGWRAPRWHYHLIDVEVLAVGWLNCLLTIRGLNPKIEDEARAALTLPWDSDALAAACGVEPPSEEDRHTALGDARWVARWYREVTS